MKEKHKMFTKWIFFTRYSNHSIEPSSTNIRIWTKDIKGQSSWIYKVK